MVFGELITDAYRMAATIAPELSTQPLYIIEQPTDFPVPWAQGYISRPTPLAIRDRLKAAGEWKGQGPCIVVVPEEITKETYDAHFSSRRIFNRVIVHELAHAVPVVSPLEDPEPTEADCIRQLASFREWASTPEPEPGEMPWDGDHGDRFIRRALHLYERTCLAGFDVVGAGLCAGWQYGLSDPRKYFEALGDEPERMREATFAEIEATDPPAAFAELFAADVAAWMKEQAEQLELRAA